uniref:Aldo_ket_red domain-containing protein n=1 Tax=Schistocephalus solidus TaxID=70667 RepID=A0A183SBH7_SCHSO
LLPCGTAMSSSAPYLTFNNGLKVPVVGLGTFRTKASEIDAALSAALDVGYRHIDCAALYQNEEEIGKVLTQKFNSGALTREEVFITTKLWNTAHRLEDVRPACEQSLKGLGLSYVDLYLMHWPIAFGVSLPTLAKIFELPDLTLVLFILYMF